MASPRPSRNHVATIFMAGDSTVETYAAVRLRIDSWRWEDVTFVIRAGKCLPVTAADVRARLQRCATLTNDDAAAEDRLTTEHFDSEPLCI